MTMSLGTNVVVVPIVHCLYVINTHIFFLIFLLFSAKSQERMRDALFPLYNNGM